MNIYLHRRTLSFLALVVTAVSFAHADPADITTVAGDFCSQPVTLDEFRALALRNTPLVSEIDSEYARDVAEAYEIEVLKNPEIQLEQTYTRMKLGGDSDPQTNASLALPLRLSNFGAKSRVAALLRKAGDTQRQTKLLELTQKIRIQYTTLYVLQRTGEILADAERRATKIIGRIQEGVSKGLFTAGDRHFFEGERYRLQAQRTGLQATFAGLYAEQSRLLGTPCLLKATSAAAFADLPTEEALLSKARTNPLSEASRIELIEHVATEQNRLASLDAIPELSPRIVYQHTNDGGDFIGAGIAIPLPVFNRNRAAIDRSSVELTASQQKRDLLAHGGIEARVRAYRIAAMQSTQQSRLFQTKALPAFEQALQSQEQLYAQGKANVLQVWQTLRILNDAQREALSVWSSAVAARVELSLFVGEEL